MATWCIVDQGTLSSIHICWKLSYSEAAALDQEELFRPSLTQINSQEEPSQAGLGGAGGSATGPTRAELVLTC